MLGVTRIIMIHIFIGIFYKDAWKERGASFPCRLQRGMRSTRAGTEGRSAERTMGRKSACSRACPVPEHCAGL